MQVHRLFGWSWALQGAGLLEVSRGLSWLSWLSWKFQHFNDDELLLGDRQRDSSDSKMVSDPSRWISVSMFGPVRSVTAVASEVSPDGCQVTCHARVASEVRWVMRSHGRVAVKFQAGPTEDCTWRLIPLGA